MLNDTSVASAGSYIRTCRRIRNSKKIATIRDFHQNICVNSTIQKSFLFSRFHTHGAGRWMVSRIYSEVYNPGGGGGNHMSEESWNTGMCRVDDPPPLFSGSSTAPESPSVGVSHESNSRKVLYFNPTFNNFCWALFKFPSFLLGYRGETCIGSNHNIG